MNVTNVFIIGSMSVVDDIEKVAEKYSALGVNVKYAKKQPDKNLEDLIEDALKCISEADMIVAVPKPDGTFGEGTTYEMMFAIHLGKTVYEVNMVKHSYCYIPYSNSIRDLANAINSVYGLTSARDKKNKV